MPYFAFWGVNPQTTHAHVFFQTHELSFTNRKICKQVHNLWRKHSLGPTGMNNSLQVMKSSKEIFLPEI